MIKELLNLIQEFDPTLDAVDDWDRGYLAGLYEAIRLAKKHSIVTDQPEIGSEVSDQ